VDAPGTVNDAAARDTFLRDGLRAALGALHDGTPPRWGRMTARQMVEHLHWSMELSTGRATADCPVPEEKRETYRRFLYHDRPSPPDFMNPVLVEGLPPLRFASLDEARAALLAEVERFLAQPPDAPGRMHPLFGLIGVEEWSRTHYKHVRHHLRQFGLLEEVP
jgi:oxepin-CoA hydrolase/3-oxo-5,6-dehydrosuberyl-CoA semialdehyde dehydrogenase